jgi:hypothetical protein
MPNRQGRGAPRLLVALALTLAASAAVSAQESGAPARAEVNHEVQLYLLVTAEGAEGAPKPPPSLDGVVRQLKSALPPADYRVAAALINRVRDGGAFELKTVGGRVFNQAQAQRQVPPSFLQLAVSGVKLIDPASAQPSINLQQFRLSMKVPILSPGVKNDKGEDTYPVMYEDAGLNTQLSVREGEPTLVGTLNTSRLDQNFVIVLVIRRTGR